ncbi:MULTISPECIES: beta-ketoacyl-[acyl-carrier-protein] synthase family protein [Streptomyces]|uniref:beta-ketoacyl-[acyl-carrier-protein] synthase family protein n=1 Tax=Streptomyces TaxID=1883 RepID=UPI00163B7E93|nr:MULTISPECIES: beta-ketoacyl-[acyl-carrier-protein] synthase family protein [Streptomyces]MBC2875744.1 beta-ketoacyl-[acyl-carrier-protein] synthase family protein [Streptomyces sp. TYQ1024]UBI37597.1 beta-ketoacyl-[acyl-carrier-protein] synthase family protein [Streptomyces mobaraensis]UKW30185.1 beta-ketoacyl-[acyl-carrier-protein] synthase family protein [Streptomyces sp. TYQ1024]
MRRVVITGLGPVSAIGIGAAAYGEALRRGASGVSPIAGFDSSGFPYYMAGEVHDFRPEDMVRRLSVEEWGRTSLFAASAARLAVADAGIDEEHLAASRAGSSMGTTGGESQVLERLTADSLAAGFHALDSGLVRQVSSARLSQAVNRELGLTGEAVTLATACSASNYALGYAYDLIRTGEADYMLAGGADSVHRWSHAGFYRLGALTEKACSPFDKDRSGIITGEGGAAMFLESLESAQSRGARIHAEVLGYGLNCDAGHMVAPDRDSIAACMRLAHRNAGIRAEDVDYICAHGTGTPTNDHVEASAVVDVFGKDAPPISSTKSMLGHAMGAASGLGAIASVLGITGSFLPPTINFNTADPDMPEIDPVPNHARPADIRIAQVNGFAFGGNNAIVILGRLS